MCDTKEYFLTKDYKVCKLNIHIKCIPESVSLACPPSLLVARDWCHAFSGCGPPLVGFPLWSVD